MKMDGLCISRGGCFARAIVVVALCLISCSAQIYSAENAAHDAPHILVVNSYHQGFKWTDELTETVTGDLMKTFPDAEMHVVYLDRKRQLSQNYLHLIREQLQYWYPQNRRMSSLRLMTPRCPLSNSGAISFSLRFPSFFAA